MKQQQTIPVEEGLSPLEWGGVQAAVERAMKYEGDLTLTYLRAVLRAGNPDRWYASRLEQVTVEAVARAVKSILSTYLWNESELSVHLDADILHVKALQEFTLPPRFDDLCQRLVQETVEAHIEMRKDRAREAKRLQRKAALEAGEWEGVYGYA